MVAVAAAVDFLAHKRGHGGAFAAAAGFGHEGGLENPEGIVVVFDASAVEEGAGGDDLVIHAPIGASAEGVEEGAPALLGLGGGEIVKRVGLVAGGRGIGFDIEDDPDRAAGGFVVEIAQDKDVGGAVAVKEAANGALQGGRQRNGRDRIPRRRRRGRASG